MGEKDSRQVALGVIKTCRRFELRGPALTCSPVLPNGPVGPGLALHARPPGACGREAGELPWPQGRTGTRWGSRRLWAGRGSQPGEQQRSGLPGCLVLIGWEAREEAASGVPQPQDIMAGVEPTGSPLVCREGWAVWGHGWGLGAGMCWDTGSSSGHHSCRHGAAACASLLLPGQRVHVRACVCV